MTEQAKESFSAWLDDNATELDVQRMMKSLESDPSLLNEFRKISEAKDLVSNSQPMNLTDGLWQKIDGLEEEIVPQNVEPSKPKQKLFKGVASVAVAASVTMAVLFSARYVAVANNESGVVNPVATNPAVETEASDSMIATQERLQKYLKEHVEQAAFNSGRAVMPIDSSTEIEVSTIEE